MRSKSGMTVLVAIGVLVVVTLIASAIQYMMNNSERGQRVAKIRFAISILENRIRLKLSLPESYTCYQVTGAGGGPETRCDLAPTFWSEFKKTIPGAKCSAGVVFCGVQIIGGPLSIQSATLPLNINNLSVSYNGTDVNLKPFTLEPIEIPSEAILSSTSGACPTAGDIFKGVQKDGSVLCVPRPSCQALPGHYFVGLNAAGDAICKPINGIDFNVAGAITEIPGITCAKASDGSQKYIDSIQFDCTTSSKNCRVNLSCKDRVDPCAIGSAFCPN